MTNRQNIVVVWRTQVGHHFKDISLEFLNGEPVDFTLDDTFEWQTINLEGMGNDIITNYVNISVVSVYQNFDDGFTELKIFGYASGIYLTIK